MAGLLKKIMPVNSRSMSGKDFDGFNPDFSIALEYTGSPVNHTLPRVFPVDIDQIPTAKIAASPAVVNNLSLTVVQPIGSKPTRPIKEVRLASWVGDLKNQTTPLNQRFSDDHCGDGFNGSGGLKNSVGKRDGGVLGGNLEDEGLPKCSCGNESSGTLGFSDSREHSHELSESSDMVGTPRDCKGIEGFRSCMNPGSLNFDEPSLVRQAFAAEITCEEEEESDGEALVCRRKKRSAVTFCEYESSEVVSQGESEDGSEPIKPVIRPVPQRPEKRGQCYFCHKGNRFTEKEACIVCNAKYCRRCIIRMMGSMPEGRKCLGCIGFPFNESKRHVLGRSSRMLRSLLHESLVKQIMDSEVLSSESIYVNGSPLCSYELMTLQNCPSPPRNLKPGKYWYDKVAGFWGKEGHKPCQIITPNLVIGGDRNENASNGKTDLFINGREITKAERWMLKAAGVQCAGKIHFWVDPDGTYIEEGMKLSKGNIWSRVWFLQTKFATILQKRTKLLCNLLSLPTPKSRHLKGKSDQTVDGALRVHRILLVGNDQSGTSTIYKQARVLYEVPFSEEERENIKFMIQSNLYGYLGRLLEGREQFEEESLTLRRRQSSDHPGPSAMSSMIQDKTEYTIGRRLKAFSDWLIKIMVSGNLDIIVPAATREYALYVEELWKDAAIQAAYSRRDELELPRVASYFLDRAVEIAKVDYEPSDTDILYAEGITTSDGLASMEFSFRQTNQDGFKSQEEQPDPVSRYQLVRAHAKTLGQNCKWLDMFEDVSIVIFCVSLTEYDEYEVNSGGFLVNKMLESKNLFESIITHPILEETNFLLILNKFDLLEEKINEVPLTKCEWFRDFNPVISRHQSRSSMAPLAQSAFHYIAVKFKRLFTSLTGRKLYVCPVTALEADTVDSALTYAREIVRWQEDKPNFSLNEFSTESIEQSSS
ncbi:hypothetical protein Cgig2_032472 [Carnegiea gigantea]|uniref:Uncharacterized protein n=1 Tax=Carnegiea gigantea TaxID=171969 RepID=A0A9Q1KWG8_9CARY|nr:hypothetical protein Cgig2_032472 [Carnegiea gigantea]